MQQPDAEIVYLEGYFSILKGFRKQDVIVCALFGVLGMPISVLLRRGQQVWILQEPTGDDLPHLLDVLGCQSFKFSRFAVVRRMRHEVIQIRDNLQLMEELFPDHGRRDNRRTAAKSAHASSMMATSLRLWSICVM